MSLSVISNVASATGLTTSAAPPGAGEGLPGEFAALLSGQTLAAMLSMAAPDAGKSGTPESNAKTVTTDSAKTTDDSAIAVTSDPAVLAAMLGNPQLQPPPERPQIASESPKSTADKTLALAISAPTDGKADARAIFALPPREGKPASPLPTEVSSALKTNEPEASAATITANTTKADAAIIAAPGDTLNKAPGDTGNFNAAMASALQRRDITAEHPVTVSAPLHSAAWPQQLGDKIVWMTKSDLQSAQININPPQLGPIQITLNLTGDQATAMFSSPHPEVRQAIESAMPQLKEMLAGAGISLGDTNVGANLAQQNQDNPFQTPNKNQSMPENAILPANDNAPTTGIAQVLHKGRGLVDLFA